MMKAQDLTHLVTVCAKCLRASCWHGLEMCDEARGAGTVEKTAAELKQMCLEHPSWWRKRA